MLSEKYVCQLMAGLDGCLVESGIQNACSYLGADLRLFKIKHEDKVFESIDWNKNSKNDYEFDQNIIEQAFNISIHLMSEFGIPRSEVPF